MSQLSTISPCNWQSPLPSEQRGLPCPASHPAHMVGCCPRTLLQTCELPHPLNHWHLCHCLFLQSRGWPPRPKRCSPMLYFSDKLNFYCCIFNFTDTFFLRPHQKTFNIQVLSSILLMIIWVFSKNMKIFSLVLFFFLFGALTSIFNILISANNSPFIATSAFLNIHYKTLQPLSLTQF